MTLYQIFDGTSLHRTFSCSGPSLPGSWVWNFGCICLWEEEERELFACYYLQTDRQTWIHRSSGRESEYLRLLKLEEIYLPLSFVTVFMAFIDIAAMIMIPTSFSTANSSFSILHQVPEGHVGVYWRGGALLREITDPGFHLKMPLITQFEPIQVTLQTDQVRDIPCGTKGGVATLDVITMF